MGKKYKHLYPLIIDQANLQAAYKSAATGKKNSHGYLVFKEFAQHKLAILHQQLFAKTWEPQPYRNFIIYEPKKRSISAPTFSDRVVHHALISVIEPIFDATFLPYSFACRTGKGTHAGVNYIQSQLRKHNYKYFLKTDFKSYFPSIDRKILHKQFAKKISCKDTLNLLAKILPQEEKGVPIGALTSQLSANIYGNILDQYLHHELKIPFARYMDDVIVLGNDIEELRKIKILIEEFSARELKMTLSKWQVSSVNRGINFLGYRIWPKYKLLRRSSVTRAKRKIKKYTQNQQWYKLQLFLGAWKGHIDKADTINLHQYLDKKYEIVKNINLTKRKTKLSRKQMLEYLINN